MAREDDILSAYSLQSSPPSKKRKQDLCEDVTTLSNKVPGRNPFSLPRSSTDETINLCPLTKILSPVKKPSAALSPMKTPTKLSSPVKKPNIKGAKRKLATTTLVLSRFFKKSATKNDNETDKETEQHADNSNEIEIKEKFLHVKSLYESSVNNGLSLYSDVDSMEQQECKSNSGCNTNSEDSARSEDIIEVKSDSEENEIKESAIKTLNKFVHQKAVSVTHFFVIFQTIVFKLVCLFRSRKYEHLALENPSRRYRQINLV